MVCHIMSERPLCPGVREWESAWRRSSPDSLCCWREQATRWPARLSPGRACYSAWAIRVDRSAHTPEPLPLGEKHSNVRVAFSVKEGEFRLWLLVDRAACAKARRFF